MQSHSLSGIQHTSVSDLDFQHIANSSNWLIGFNNSTTIDSYAGTVGVGQKTQSATSTRHSGSNRVASVTRFPGDAENALTTSYGYDSFGNRTSTNLSGANVASRSSSVSSLLNNRYPQTLTNALSQITTVNEYDLRFGLAKRVTDPNLLEAEVSYDAFGRIKTSTDVDGNTTSINYDSCSLVVCDDVGSISPAFMVTTSSPISPTQTQYFDRIGRLIRSEVEAFDVTSSTPIVQDIYYDSQGRVSHYTLPYFKGGAAQNISRQYDIRNRVRQENRPDGGATTITYAVQGNQVRVTTTETINKSDGSSDGSQTQTSDFNILGQLTSTTDASGQRRSGEYQLQL